MNTQNIEINKDSYVAFDATSLRDLIVTRLNQNNVFTDQNFVGSNISSFIEIISYSFMTLMFYLNKTSTESMYSEAQLYENMNRIVKLIGYDPIGNQTASVNYNLSAQNINAGSYTIPRYTYALIGDSAYTFAKDVSFAKSTNNTIESIPSNNIKYKLYQGKYFEYPTYTATGSDNEVVFLAVDDTLIIDHFTLDVYVKDSKTDKWYQWDRVDNLYSYGPRDRVFEVRLNENKRYEFKFGNDINGKKLYANDLVAIFYISSSGTNGEIGSSALLGTVLAKFNSLNYQNILTDTSTTAFIEDEVYRNLIINNPHPSTSFTSFESVDNIRNKASKFYKSQNRIITTQDYITHILTNYSNIISDLAVKNNTEYIESYIKYFYDIGLSAPQLESRVLYNQVNFANACNFNNIYLIALPTAVGLSYLMPTQKEDIISSITPLIGATVEPCFVDPVYVVADIAIKSNNNPSLADIDDTEIVIELDKFSKQSTESIKNNIRNIFNKFFSKSNLKLGSFVNIYQIYTDILNVAGVKKCYCRNKKTLSTSEGISLIVWNPIYPETDITVTTQNFTLPYFKVLTLNSVDSIINRIMFDSVSTTLQNISI
jgi:hypothetical protein